MVKRYDCTDGGAQFCAGCYTMTEDSLGDYVKFDEYNAVELRVLEALRVLNTIDETGDDHYYGIADQARLILRGIGATALPVVGNCPFCGEPKADHAEVAPDGKPECRMKSKSVCRQCGGFVDTLGRCRVSAHNTVSGG